MRRGSSTGKIARRRANVPLPMPGFLASLSLKGEIWLPSADISGKEDAACPRGRAHALPERGVKESTRSRDLGPGPGRSPVSGHGTLSA
jgi:hypothetical protein